MSLMMGSVYDAFRSANVPDDKARAAAQDIAQYDDRFNNVERRLDVMKADMTLIKWMVGLNTALCVGILARLLMP